MKILSLVYLTICPRGQKAYRYKEITQCATDVLGPNLLFSKRELTRTLELQLPGFQISIEVVIPVVGIIMGKDCNYHWTANQIFLEILLFRGFSDAQ